MVLLTAEERRALLFLLVMALLGSCVEVLGQRTGPVSVAVREPLRFTKADINAASVQDIVMSRALPPKLATALVASRAADGPFSTMQELTRVKGIKEARLQRLKRYFCVPAEGP